MDTKKIECMERLGITSEQVEVFKYKQYKYENLKDAISFAERDQAATPKDQK